MKPLTWKTVRRKVSELKGMPRNPRKLTDEQRAQLTKSIQKFNLVEIPAIDTDNTVIAGHQRISVLIDLGRQNETIDVRIPSRKLTAAERREYNIRSNKNTGEWDVEILASDFKAEQLNDYGFSENDLTGIFKTDQKTKQVAFTANDHIYEILIECKNERHQKEIYKMLTAKGIECKIITL
jgi:hypothetical protein